MAPPPQKRRQKREIHKTNLCNIDVKKNMNLQGYLEIKHQFNMSLFLCCSDDGTYRAGRAGVSRAAWVSWHGGSGPNCSASCSSCRHTPELWPLCCWTMEAPLSQWWATAAGSWLSSDCAKAWFGSVWLWETQREEEARWIEGMYKSPASCIPRPTILPFC